MLRIGALLMVVGAAVLAPWAALPAGAAAAGAPGICPAPAAVLLAPAPRPVFLSSCIQCRGGVITGPAHSATSSSCPLATSALDAALRAAANSDCQNRGYDFVCSTDYSVAITSPCTTVSGGISVGGHAVYGCSLNIC